MGTYSFTHLPIYLHTHIPLYPPGAMPKLVWTCLRKHLRRHGTDTPPFLSCRVRQFFCRIETSGYDRCICHELRIALAVAYNIQGWASVCRVRSFAPFLIFLRGWCDFIAPYHLPYSKRSFRRTSQKAPRAPFLIASTSWALSL